MVDLAHIKADLPDWPDEVIEQWLLKLANRGTDTGWPPPEPLGDSAWKYILGLRPLSWWKNVAWKSEERDIDFSVLCNSTKRIVNGMISGHINDKPNIYSAGPDSKDRFFSAMKFLSEHGRVPGALVVMQLNDGLSVIDGNHRVAALCARQAVSDEIIKRGGLVPAKAQSIWMGEHAAGEVPSD